MCVHDKVSGAAARHLRTITHLVEKPARELQRGVLRHDKEDTYTRASSDRTHAFNL